MEAEDQRKRAFLRPDQHQDYQGAEGELAHLQTQGGIVPGHCSQSGADIVELLEIVSYFVFSSRCIWPFSTCFCSQQFLVLTVRNNLWC